MRVLGVVVAGILAGCSSAAPVLGEARDPILGGSATTTGQFPTVVALLETQVGDLCTGTLISSTAVLTAAHCVDPALLGRTQQQIVAETVVVLDTLDAYSQTAGTMVAAQVVYENPNHPDFTGAGDLGHDDDAIVILAHPITDRMPNTVDLDPTHVKIGVATTQVGYGISQLTNNVPDGNSAGVEHVVTGQIVGDCGSSSQNANVLCFDQTNRRGQCSGDSGGPAFDPNGVLIGVVSFGDQNCIQFGWDTRPSQTAAFIQQYVPNINSAPVCGNGLVEYGEACDDGASNGQAADPCDVSCAPAQPAGSGSGGGSGSGSGSGSDGEPMHDRGGCSTGGASDLTVALLVASACAGGRRRRARVRG